MYMLLPILQLVYVVAGCSLMSQGFATVGALYERALFVESTKYARSQTAPTVLTSLENGFDTKDLVALGFSGRSVSLERGLKPATTYATQETEFQYEVLRSRAMQKDEPGQLRINESGIEYRSANRKTTVNLPFIDVHEMNVSDHSMIRIETYEMLKRKLSGRRSYVFRLRSPRSADENDHLTKFLSARVRRPVLGSQSISAKPEYEIPAYHRHVLSGCDGTLQIMPEGIRFLSTKEDHSRTWRYSEIQTIGGSDEFSFRITTSAETFTFDLKESLPREAYDSVWQRVYELPSRYGTDRSETERKP